MRYRSLWSKPTIWDLLVMPIISGGALDATPGRYWTLLSRPWRIGAAMNDGTKKKGINKRSPSLINN